MNSYECEAEHLAGLGEFAKHELESTFREQIQIIQSTPTALRFRYRGVLSALLTLRTVLAIYLVHRFAVPRPKALLGQEHFSHLIHLLKKPLALYPASTFQTMRISAAGEDTTTLQRLKGAIAEQLNLEVSDKEAQLLLRLRRERDVPGSVGGWEVLARLSPAPLAARAWRVCNLPGALQANVASVIVGLTQPRTDEVFLNLACGSGTLLIERMAAGPARQLLGCDTDPQALACAAANIRAFGFHISLELAPWDVTELPLPAGSVNVLCADLPFGHLVGSHETNRQIYPRILHEAARVAAPRACFALVTHEYPLLDAVLASIPELWKVEGVFPVWLPFKSGTFQVRVYLLKRASESRL